jgi:hypothetical protein
VLLRVLIALLDILAPAGLLPAQAALLAAFPIPLAQLAALCVLPARSAQDSQPLLAVLAALGPTVRIAIPRAVMPVQQVPMDPTPAWPRVFPVLVALSVLLARIQLLLALLAPLVRVQVRPAALSVLVARMVLLRVWWSVQIVLPATFAPLEQILRLPATLDSMQTPPLPLVSLALLAILALLPPLRILTLARLELIPPRWARLVVLLVHLERMLR